MDFLDEAIITARSGDGGKGCISFRRAKYIPRGGPDGGDGGDGGGVTIRATERLNSLTHFKYRRHFNARSGEPGKGKNQTGRDGKDVTIEVPPGTTVYDCETGEVIADLIDREQEALILRGGRGGKGNQHFATSTNRAPRKAQPGVPGEERRLRLSLRTLAHIGLVGLPNTGKSTLLSRLTNARPKIDHYPFTTLVPNLGVLTLDSERSLTVADIPGLIEGASLGRGLGHRFLKHIERTRLLLHVIDITYVPVSHILEDYLLLRKELGNYNPLLLGKDQVVVINKMDLGRFAKRDMVEVSESLGRMGLEAHLVSALTGEGIEELKEALVRVFFEGQGNE